MKIRFAVAEDAGAAEAALAEAVAGLTIKTNAPRRNAYRKGGGGAKFVQRKRKAAQFYKRNKPKIARRNKIYRKRNKLALERRADFLKRAPKKPLKVRSA